MSNEEPNEPRHPGHVGEDVRYELPYPAGFAICGNCKERIPADRTECPFCHAKFRGRKGFEMNTVRRIRNEDERLLSKPRHWRIVNRKVRNVGVRAVAQFGWYAIKRTYRGDECVFVKEIEEIYVTQDEAKSRHPEAALGRA